MHPLCLFITAHPPNSTLVPRSSRTAFITTARPLRTHLTANVSKSKRCKLTITASSTPSASSEETTPKVNKRPKITITSIVLLTVGILTSIPTLILMLITLPFPKQFRPHPFLLRLFLRLTFTLSFLPIRRLNVNNLPASTTSATASVPPIMISNRQSPLDLFAIIASIPYAIRFIIPPAALRIPILGTILKLSGLCLVLPTDRKSAMSLLSQPSELPLLLFPEGKPGNDGRISKFLSQGFKSPFKNKAQVIPISVSGGWHICKGNGNQGGVVPVRWGPVHVVFNHGICPDETNSEKELAASTFDAVNRGLPLQFQAQ